MDPRPPYKFDPEIKKELAPEVRTHEVVRPTPNLTNHRWRQQGGPGGRIECNTCEWPHGFHPKATELLTGIDERGYPVLKSIST